MRTDIARRGFTLLELIISLAVATLLLSILVPALTRARVASHRERCAAHLGQCAHAWHLYLEEHEGAFPSVPVQSGWRYGGVRFSALDGTAFLDMDRPLSAYFARTSSDAAEILRCPADLGITAGAGAGTGDRTAFASFGTSYRANDWLLDSRRAGLDVLRPLRRDEVRTVPSRLVLMGDPLWYERYLDTGRNAVWHEDVDRANLLFLDGAVKYRQVPARPRMGPAVFEPLLASGAEGVVPRGDEAP